MNKRYRRHILIGVLCVLLTSILVGCDRDPVATKTPSAPSSLITNPADESAADTTVSAAPSAATTPADEITLAPSSDQDDGASGAPEFSVDLEKDAPTQSTGKMSGSTTATTTTSVSSAAFAAVPTTVQYEDMSGFSPWQ